MKHRVFISYRRDDSRWVVKNIYQNLLKVFSKDQIFMDVDGISYGADFKKTIQEQVKECNVLIAVIGKNWLHSVDKNGKRRIDDPNDFVRIEISTALKREIRVIPLLVDKASMPSSEELPEELSSLTWRNAIEVSDLNFDVDVKRLVKSLRKDTDNVQQRRKSILIIFSVLILIFGVWGSYKLINKQPLKDTDEQKDWKIASSLNDSLSYINYIKKHVNGEHKEIALHILDSIRLKNYAPNLDSNKSNENKFRVPDSSSISTVDNTSNSEQVDYFAEGLILYHKSRFKEAIPKFLKSDEFLKKDHELFFYLGYSYYAIENYGDAVKYLEISVETSNSRDKYPLFWLGYIYYRELHEFFKALSCFEKLTSNNDWENFFAKDTYPYVPEIYYYRGASKVMLDYKEEGCADIKKAYELGFTKASMPRCN